MAPPMTCAVKGRTSCPVGASAPAASTTPRTIAAPDPIETSNDGRTAQPPPMRRADVTAAASSMTARYGPTATGCAKIHPMTRATRASLHRGTQDRDEGVGDRATSRPRHDPAREGEQGQDCDGEPQEVGEGHGEIVSETWRVPGRAGQRYHSSSIVESLDGSTRSPSP